MSYLSWMLERNMEKRGICMLINERGSRAPLFKKKGWNEIDSGFRLWGSGDGKAAEQQEIASVDSFLASKGWNDMDSGFRLL